MAVTSKKPEADFVIRLVGPGLRPWEVSFRKLATTLQAVQRLMEPEDLGGAGEVEDTSDELEESPRERPESSMALKLLGVRNGSAAYPVSSENRQRCLSILSETGQSIDSPAKASWHAHTLSSISDLSQIAASLDCEIEFRTYAHGKQHGGILAVIRPNTYASIESTAFIVGFTSVMGRIERVGGATERRCGLRLADQPRKMVICGVSSEELVRELGGYIYQDIVVSGKATWLRRDWSLKTIEISSVEAPKVGSIKAALERAYEAGGFAWDEIKDPEAKIAEMRGR